MVKIDSTLNVRLNQYLDSELVDLLPDSDAMRIANQRLNSLYKTVSSFLPRYVAELEGNLIQDYGSLTSGTIMFADVSGFTALSEKVMREVGSEGIELLTRIFNDYFATMLEILAKSEGDLLKFAGDALLAFFPGHQYYDEFPRAVKAGLRMQRSMIEHFQPIRDGALAKWFGEHNLELTMSIGVARGQLFEALVGNLSQRDHMIMGHLPGQANAAEEVGRRDDVIIATDLAKQYADVFETQLISDGFSQVIDNFGDELGDYEFSIPQRKRTKSSFLFSFDEEDLLKDMINILEKVESISRYVSSEIVNKLVIQGDHIESENRLTTVIFVHFTGFAELLEEVLGEENLQIVVTILSRYYSIMQRVVASNGGVLTRSDPYKLGSKLLITFGAPVAHPDDPDRAVMTALEMNRQLRLFNERLGEELPDISSVYIEQRMGITQGIAFAGEVGWQQRREYTVMGDDVNLAARLMAKANFGQIRISEKVWQRVQPYFETVALPLFEAKGKNLPIQSYAVIGIKKRSVSHTSDTPFVGRRVVLLSLNMVLQQAKWRTKYPRVIGVSGDVGMGKTRLAKQLVLLAESSNFKVAWVSCRSHSSRKVAWASIISQLLDLNLMSSAFEQKQQLEASLSELQLSDILDPFLNLLELEKGVSKTSSKSVSKKSSEIRSDIYAKLSSSETLAMEKDTLSAFRKKLKRSLKRESAYKLSLWEDIQLGMSLTEALVCFLEAYAKETRVLLVFDDFHKENQRVLNMLKQVSERVRDSKLVILVTYDTMADLDVELSQVAVTDFSEEETYLMISAILAHPEVGVKLAKFIWESSSGRPLFIEALLHTLVEDNQLYEKEGAMELVPGANLASIPDNVRGLVISRIDRLSSESRAVVRAAAILEHSITKSALCFVSEISEQKIYQIIDELLKLRVFETQDSQFFYFKHGVTQSAVYDELTRLQRQVLHLRAADYYAQERDIEQKLINMVYHLLRAGNLSRAVGELKEAAERAEQSKDVDQAIEYYARAIEILPDDDLRQRKEFLEQMRFSS